MDGHRQLLVWQTAKQLVVEIYALTRGLPADERYISIQQLKRAARSVTNNIAEGNARRGRAQLVQFLNCAIGSLGEIDSMTAILPDLFDLDPTHLAAVNALRVEVTRGIFALMR